MSACIDSSVLLSWYLGEPRAAEAAALIGAEQIRIGSRLVEIEVRRGLALITQPTLRARARAAFAQDWTTFVAVDLDAPVAELASSIVEATGVRSLDAVHIAVAVAAQCERLVTFDRRQAQAARVYGLNVLGDGAFG